MKKRKIVKKFEDFDFNFGNEWKKYLKRNEIKKENIIHLGNSLAMSFIGTLFKEKPKREIKTINFKKYLIIDPQEYYKNLERLAFHIVPKEFEFKLKLEIVKMNLDYYFYQLLSNFISSTPKELFQSYINFMTYYFMLNLVYHRLENKIFNSSEEFDDAKLFDSHLNSFVFTFYNLPGFSKILKITPKKNQQSIINYRKKKLKQNLQYYYLFSFVDYNRFYLDAYYDISRLTLQKFENQDLEIVELINFVKPPKRIFVKDPVMNCKYYNNAFYFYLDNPDKKLKYFISLTRYFKVPYFKKKDVIDFYPDLSPTILNIQKDLKISTRY